MTVLSQTTDQAGQDQLDTVAAEFERWRSQKTTSAQRIPEALMREAQKLSQHYKASNVRRRLGLSKAQMDKLDAPDQTQHHQVQAEGLDDTSSFMRLVPHQEEVHHTELTVDVCTPQGVKISLSGFSTQDPLAVIAKLIGV